MRKFVYTFFIAILFYSCTSSKTADQQGDSASSTVSQQPAQVPDKTPVIFKGMYTFGNEVNTFRDCSNQQTYWVNDSLGNLQKLYGKALQPLSYPYESVYAELKGYLAGKSTLGYASEYENVLVVTDIIKLEAKSLRTACFDYEFIALGNEPFWSLEIVPEEQRITLKELGADKVYQFPYQPANIGGGVHRFETSNDLKDKLVIVIREEPCTDGMSDNKYHYSAELVINQRTLKGCAVKKGDRPVNQ
jgi:uncharacterized membrane protein